MNVGIQGQGRRSDVGTEVRLSGARLSFPKVKGLCEKNNLFSRTFTAVTSKSDRSIDLLAIAEHS